MAGEEHAYTVRIGTPDRHWSDDGFCDDAPIMANSPAEAMRKRVDTFNGEIDEVFVFGPPEPGVHAWAGFAIVAPPPAPPEEAPHG